MKQLSRNLDETYTLARSFLSSLKPGNRAVIVALFGDLGSGKTAFVKKCAEVLGIKDTIISPTFVIEKIYKIPEKSGSFWKQFVHIDAYRLEDESETKHLGLDDLVRDAHNIIFIEWPERIKRALPKEREEIYFKFIDDNTREINISDGKR